MRTLRALLVFLNIPQFLFKIFFSTVVVLFPSFGIHFFFPKISSCDFFFPK